MRVLGVDPGLTRCGYGVVDGEVGRPLRTVDYGVIRTPAGAEIGDRLCVVADVLIDQIARHRPDIVAVERVFSQHNVRTVMGTAQASAMAIVAATRAGLPVAHHTPSEVKAAVTGSGRADKDQVTSMVVRLLKLTERPSPADVADALALAICHIWRGPAQSRLAGAAAAAAQQSRHADVVKKAIAEQAAARQAIAEQLAARRAGAARPAASGGVRRVSGGRATVRAVPAADPAPARRPGR